MAERSDVAELYSLIQPQLRQESGTKKRYAMHVPIAHLAPVEEPGF